MYMKLNQESTAIIEMPREIHKIRLLNGLVGFHDLTEVEIIYSEEELPFMRMREVPINKKANTILEFFVVQPSTVLQNYSIKVSQGDLDHLDIKSSEDASLLVIASLEMTEKGRRVTVNLAAPILINKSTLKGKQIIIENFKEYSPTHLLYEDNHA